MKRLFLVFLFLNLTQCVFAQEQRLFAIRTITAGVTLSDLTDSASIKLAIAFLKDA